jgi:hypothetical protein
VWVSGDAQTTSKSCTNRALHHTRAASADMVPPPPHTHAHTRKKEEWWWWWCVCVGRGRPTRDSPQITIGSPPVRPSIMGPTSIAICFTASKSPCDAIGKPASHTSTPMKLSCLAIVNFSFCDSVAPGDCSPGVVVVYVCVWMSASRDR